MIVCAACDSVAVAVLYAASQVALRQTFVFFYPHYSGVNMAIVVLVHRSYYFGAQACAWALVGLLSSLVTSVSVLVTGSCKWDHRALCAQLLFETASSWVISPRPMRVFQHRELTQHLRSWMRYQVSTASAHGWVQIRSWKMHFRQHWGQRPDSATSFT